MEAPDSGTVAILAGAIVTLVTLVATLTTLTVKALLKFLTKTLVTHLERVEDRVETGFGVIAAEFRGLRNDMRRGLTFERAEDDDAGLVDEDPPQEAAAQAVDPAFDKTPVTSIEAIRRRRRAAGQYGPGKPGGKEG